MRQFTPPLLFAKCQCINKFIDREWYYRKFRNIYKKFASKEQVAHLELIHKIRLTYEATFHQPLHLHRPRTLNEKLIWLALYWQHPLKSRCADKWRVRDYVTKDCGLPTSLLVPIIATYDSVSEIDFDTLPNQFVLKCNHGCGYNILVNDKSKIDQEQIRHQLNEWMKIDYRGSIAEFHYKDIHPHKILCEKYLQQTEKASMTDYKIFCINGEPQFVHVCHDRDEHGMAQLAAYTLDWVRFDCDDSNIERPKSLNKMIEYAKVLSKDFPFVRVDFYEVDEHPIFGELTFTPYGNMIDYFSNDTLTKYGQLLQLPKKYNLKDDC